MWRPDADGGCLSQLLSTLFSASGAYWAGWTQLVPLAPVLGLQLHTCPFTWVLRVKLICSWLHSKQTSPPPPNNTFTITKWWLCLFMSHRFPTSPPSFNGNLQWKILKQKTHMCNQVLGTYLSPTMCCGCVTSCSSVFLFSSSSWHSVLSTLPLSCFTHNSSRNPTDTQRFAICVSGCKC